MKLNLRENKIFYLAAIVAIGFVATIIIPIVQALYLERQGNIEEVLLDIEREQRLIENTAAWRERRVVAEQRAMDLEQEIFVGTTIPLIEADIQRDLSQHVRDSGILVNATRLADRLETEGWLMISQEMSFRTANVANTVGLLERLENSMPKLFVKDFSINRTRAQYTGSITVVGFARSQGLVLGSINEC
ncbi:MAG: GspMb/PilO family protein [Gammaproteobacteria bacterium]|nr:GspMb/PilO family protein [Gammaproteobacteria bacterium]